MIPMQANTEINAGFLEFLEQVLTKIGQNAPSPMSLLAEKANFLTVAPGVAAPLPVDGTPYSRKVIYNGPLGDVMVAHWPAGARCFPHDHGGAHGLVTVLRGEFFEQPYRRGKTFAAHGPEHLFALGDIEAVVPSEIHSLRAVTEGITLHLYSPPIRGMKVYDEHNQIIYTVADDCGAWVPSDQSRILHREPFGANSLHD